MLRWYCVNGDLLILCPALWLIAHLDYAGQGSAKCDLCLYDGHNRHLYRFSRQLRKYEEWRFLLPCRSRKPYVCGACMFRKLAAFLPSSAKTAGGRLLCSEAKIQLMGHLFGRVHSSGFIGNILQTNRKLWLDQWQDKDIICQVSSARFHQCTC